MKNSQKKEIKLIASRLLKLALKDDEVLDFTFRSPHSTENQPINKSDTETDFISNFTTRAVEFAMEEIERRKLRSRFIPEDLVFDGSWNILLDLYIADHCAENVSVSSACIASNRPQTSALRWIKLMEDHGLIERQADWKDARRFLLNLTPEGKSSMTQLLCKMLTLELDAKRLATIRSHKLDVK